MCFLLRWDRQEISRCLQQSSCGAIWERQFDDSLEAAFGTAEKVFGGAYCAVVHLHIALSWVQREAEVTVADGPMSSAEFSETPAQAQRRKGDRHFGPFRIFRFGGYIH